MINDYGLFYIFSFWLLICHLSCSYERDRCRVKKIIIDHLLISVLGYSGWFVLYALKLILKTFIKDSKNIVFKVIKIKNITIDYVF